MVTILSGLWMACHTNPSPPPTPEPVVEPAPAPADAPASFVNPLPEADRPLPATIVVTNPTGAPVSMDVSFGALEPLHVSFADPQAAPVMLHGTEYCPCPCSGTPCPECEPPLEVLQTIAPGEAYTASWTGQLARYRRTEHGSCFDVLDPPPGEYVFVACSHAQECGATSATLPTDGPITISLGAGLPDSRCPMDPVVVERATRSVLHRMQQQDIIGDRIRQCDPTAPVTCLEADEDIPTDRVPPGQCAVFVRPSDTVMELIVLARLPEGQLGGERFTTTMDSLGIRVFRVFYEQ